MLLNEYLDENLLSTVMIKLKVDDKEDFCYTLWNQFNDQFHLLKEDYSIGHIIHKSDAVLKEDGSLVVTSKYHPKKCVMNFYFGGADLTKQ